MKYVNVCCKLWLLLDFCVGSFCGFEVFVVFVACKSEDSRILENIEVSMEEGCAEETYKAAEPLLNATSSSSSSIYQIVTNADGTVSLVGLDPAQLDQLLNMQGDVDTVCWNHCCYCYYYYIHIPCSKAPVLAAAGRVVFSSV